MLKYYYFRAMVCLVIIFFTVWAYRYGQTYPEIYSIKSWLTIAAMLGTILAITIYASSRKKGWVTIWAYAMLAAFDGSSMLFLSNIDNVVRLLAVLAVGVVICLTAVFSDFIVDVLAPKQRVPEWDEFDEQQHDHDHDHDDQTEDEGLSLIRGE